MRDGVNVSGRKEREWVMGPGIERKGSGQWLTEGEGCETGEKERGRGRKRERRR